MNKTEQLLVHLLACFVNGSKPEIKTEYNCDELYELAIAQSVTGIISYMLHKHKIGDMLKADERLSASFDKTVAVYVRKDIEFMNLCSALSEAGIPHIIFKGSVVKRWYPVPELRTFGDIDLIIREEDRKKSHKLMTDLGFNFKIMDGGAVYGYKKGKEFYELHTTLNSEQTKLSECMRNYWNYAKPVNGCTFEFDNEFHLSYLISHIEKHVYGSGAGIRLYLDIAMFLKKYGNDFDMDKVRDILKECRLERFFDTVLDLCNRWFLTEAEPSERLSEELYDELCRITLRGGTFGYYCKEKTADSEIRRAVKSDGKINKFALIVSHVFPPYREVRRMYPFVNGKPWLLPAGWCVHLFKASRRSGVKNIRRIATADVNAARTERELLEQIGSKR